MTEAAEANGRLRPGQPVVEYTGGSTGVSLAMVCVVKGYPLHIVTLQCDSGLEDLSTELYGNHES